MRTKLAILFTSVMTLLPALAEAHPGHEGHGGPIVIGPPGLTISDVLLAAVVGVGAMGILRGLKRAWDWWQESSRD